MPDNDHAAAPAPAPAPSRRRGSPLLAVLALLLVALFAGLGTWQVFRLQWKLDLITRVNERVHAAPTTPPPAARWGGITSESDEYRRVRASGTYLYDLTTPVQALTEAGSGYWLLTPMCTADGQIILINRGFIAAELGARTRYAARRAGPDPCREAASSLPASVVGLLRTSERGGPFTRANDPAQSRWYSRNVGQIAAARGLTGVAPFFIDAAAGQNPPGSPDQPEGGLTVVAFANSHLMYAVTWYALALMVGAAWWWVTRRGNAEDDEDAG